MPAVGGEDVVVGPQAGARSDRDGLVAGGQVGGALHQAGQEQVVGGLLRSPDHSHLLVQGKQFTRANHVRGGAHGGHVADLRSPRPAGVFRCDWLSRSVPSAPPTVQYFRPATSSSSAGDLLVTRRPAGGLATPPPLPCPHPPAPSWP